MAYSGIGEGTSLSPYKITTLSQLREIPLTVFDKTFNGIGTNSLLINEASASTILGQHSYKFKINGGGSVSAINWNLPNPGSGYAVGDTVKILGNYSTHSVLTITSIGAGGSVAMYGWSITSGGSGYSTGNRATETLTGNGSGLVVTIQSVTELTYACSKDEGSYGSNNVVSTSISIDGLTVYFSSTTGLMVNDEWLIEKNEKFYILDNDIDCADFDNYNNCLRVLEFRGNFDGNGYTIDNITIGVVSSPLFELKSGATFKNVNLHITKSVNNNEYGKERTVFGEVSAVLSNVTIENIHIITSSSGQVSTLTGPLVTFMQSCVVKNIVFEGDIINPFAGNIACTIEAFKVLRLKQLPHQYVYLYLVNELSGTGKLINCQHIVLNQTLTYGNHALAARTVNSGAVIDGFYGYANIITDFGTNDSSSQLNLICGAYSDSSGYVIKNCLIEGNYDFNKTSGYFINKQATLQNNVINATIIDPSLTRKIFIVNSTNASYNFYNKSLLSDLTPTDENNKQVGLVGQDFLDVTKYVNFDFDDIWIMGDSGPKLRNNPLYNYNTALKTVTIDSITRQSSTIVNVVLEKQFVDDYGIDVIKNGNIIDTYNGSEIQCLLPPLDDVFTIKSFFIDNNEKIYIDEIVYTHYSKDSAVQVSELSVIESSALSVNPAMRIHGSMYLDGNMYGVSRGTPFNPVHGTLSIVPLQDVSQYQNIILRTASEDDYPDTYYTSIPNNVDRYAAYLTDMEQLVHCRGFLYTTGANNVPIDSTKLVQYNPVTRTYKVFSIGSIHDASIPIFTDGENLFFTSRGNAIVSKVSAIQFESESLPQFNTSSVFPITVLATYNYDSQGGHILGNYDPTYKGVPHSGVVDATHLYLAFTTSGNNGYIESIDKNCYELHKIKLSDMSADGFCIIPKSTDDCTQTSTHIFFGIEVQTGSHPNTFGRNYGAYAVRKSDLRLTALPRLHSLDDPLQHQSYASIVFGNYLLDFKTNRMVYVIDITDVDNWNADEQIGERTLYAYNDAVNSLYPINEIALDESGLFIGFRWAEPSIAVKFIINDLDFFKEPTVQVIDCEIDEYDVIFRGYVVDNGGKSIQDVKIIYGTSEDSLTEIIAATLINNYIISDVTTIPPGIYFYKIYAENSVGIGYSDTKTFEILNLIDSPTLEISNITINGRNAIIQSEIVNNGGDYIVNRGFILSKTIEFSEEDVYEIVTDEFILTLNNLEYGKLFVKAFASNSAGIGYSDIVDLLIIGSADAPLNTSVTINVKIHISWDTPLNLRGGTVLGYNVYRSEFNSDDWLHLNTEELIEQNYFVDITSIGKYKYKVHVVTDFGESDGSEIIASVNSEPVYKLYIGDHAGGISFLI